MQTSIANCLGNCIRNSFARRQKSRGTAYREISFALLRVRTSEVFRCYRRNNTWDARLNMKSQFTVQCEWNEENRQGHSECLFLQGQVLQCRQCCCWLHCSTGMASYCPIFILPELFFPLLLRPSALAVRAWMKLQPTHCLPLIFADPETESFSSTEKHQNLLEDYIAELVLDEIKHFALTM